MKNDWAERLINGAAGMGIALSGAQAALFADYTALLLEKNKVMNLTAITDPDEMLTRHYLDSLSPLMTGVFAEGSKVVDIGAGAGFPSLPLKIARPDLAVTMLDSLNKRVGFLGEAIDALGLDGITAVHMRAEDGGRGPMRESFDVAVARAVADLAVLAEYALPFVRLGGRFIAMKGGEPEEETASAMAAIKTLGGKLAEVKKVEIGGELLHSLCVIEKIGKTPSEYPRKAGKPAKEPIK